MRLGSLLIFVLFLVGCSGFDIVHKDYNESDNAEGYVFYAPKALYIHGCSIDEKGVATYSDDFKYVPDYSRPYTLKINNRLGDNNVKADFSNGWMLTSINGDYKSPEATVGKVMDIADNAFGKLNIAHQQAVKGKITITTSCESYICELKDIQAMTKIDGENCKVVTSTRTIVVDASGVKP